MYVSRQKSRLEATKVLPRPCLDVLMPRSYGFGLVATRGIGTPMLRYDIIIHIHNVYPFIYCIKQILGYVFKTFKTKLHLCIQQRI